MIINSKQVQQIISFFGRLKKQMAAIIYYICIQNFPQGFIKRRVCKFIIQSQEENKKSKQMNYCIDIHYSMPVCPEKQRQSFHQGQLGKNKAERKQQNSKKMRIKKTNFVWTVKEQRSYISFLKTEGHLFHLSPKERKIIKINLQMSNRVKSRSAPQCHSHHQKMVSKYGTLEAIIQAYHNLYIREKKQELKEDAEESPVEHSIVEKARDQPEFMEMNDQRQGSKKPIWWQYLDLMESPSDQFKHYPYEFDSYTSLDLL